MPVSGADLLAFVLLSPGRSWDPWRGRGLANCSLCVCFSSAPHPPPNTQKSSPVHHPGKGKLADRVHILAESAGDFFSHRPPHRSARFQNFARHLLRTKQCGLNWIRSLVKTIKTPCSSAHPHTLSRPPSSATFPSMQTPTHPLSLLPTTPPPSPNNRMDEAVYHFSFPCEFHGERFSHGPEEASELASNPRENRNRKVRCVPDVKTL